VFKVIPYSAQIFFCWELPARYEMINMLNTPDLRPEKWQQEQLRLFRDWENMKLENFGFMKDENDNWIENPLYQHDVIVSELTEKPKQIVSMLLS
jgi:hypothetical protein